MSGYGTLSTAFYDADKPAAPADALAFYRAEARRAGGPVFEPLCGSGRFLLPLAQAGVDIDGSDASPAMLAACRARAAALGLAPGLQEQAFDALDPPRRYAMALVPAGSIGLVADLAALRQGLRRLRAALRDGGVAWLELIEFDAGAAQAAVAQAMPAREVALAGGERITYECRTRLAGDGQCLLYLGRYRRLRGADVVAEEAESLALRCWPRGAFAGELAAAGFVRASAEPAPAARTWLADAGCTLYRAEAPGA